MRETCREILKGHFGNSHMLSASIPMKPASYFNSGITKAALGKHSAAILDYDEAIRLDPNDAWSLSQSGIC